MITPGVGIVMDQCWELQKNIGNEGGMEWDSRMMGTEKCRGMGDGVDRGAGSNNIKRRDIYMEGTKGEEGIIRRLCWFPTLGGMSMVK